MVQSLCQAVPVLLQVIKFIICWLKVREVQDHVIHMDITVCDVLVPDQLQTLAELLQYQSKLVLFQLAALSVRCDQIKQVFTVAVLRDDDTCPVLQLQ